MDGLPRTVGSEPLLRFGNTLLTRRSFPRLLLYCLSLDVGIAQVNRMLEVGDSQGARGVRVRVNSRRFVSIASVGHAAAELSETLLGDVNMKLPVICVRFNLLVDHLLEGLSFAEIQRWKSTAAAR